MFGICCAGVGLANGIQLMETWRFALRNSLSLARTFTWATNRNTIAKSSAGIPVRSTVYPAHWNIFESANTWNWIAQWHLVRTVSVKARQTWWRRTWRRRTWTFSWTGWNDSSAAGASTVWVRPAIGSTDRVPLLSTSTTRIILQQATIGNR